MIYDPFCPIRFSQKLNFEVKFSHNSKFNCCSFSLVLVTRLKEGLRRLFGYTDDSPCHSKELGCRWCYRRLSDDKAYWMLYNRENGTVDTECIRRNSFLTEPIRMEKTLDKCMVCRNRQVLYFYF